MFMFVVSRIYFLRVRAAILYPRKCFSFYVFCAVRLYVPTSYFIQNNECGSNWIGTRKESVSKRKQDTQFVKRPPDKSLNTGDYYTPKWRKKIYRTGERYRMFLFLWIKIILTMQHISTTKIIIKIKANQCKMNCKQKWMCKVYVLFFALLLPINFLLICLEVCSHHITIAKCWIPFGHWLLFEMSFTEHTKHNAICSHFIFLSNVDKILFILFTSRNESASERELFFKCIPCEFHIEQQVFPSSIAIKSEFFFSEFHTSKFILRMEPKFGFYFTLILVDTTKNKSNHTKWVIFS